MTDIDDKFFSYFLITKVSPSFLVVFKKEKNLVKEKAKILRKSKSCMSVSAHCFSQKKQLIYLRQFRKTIRYGRFEPKTTILAKESHDPFARIAVSA